MRYKIHDILEESEVAVSVDSSILALCIALSSDSLLADFKTILKNSHLLQVSE
jgi:hypothetical protein